MLQSLHIENVAVIKNLDLDFNGGFTALTGETGAGKSIIIDSINLLLGAKADRELIRTGESCAMVSGVFADLCEAALNRLADAGISPDEEGGIIVQRNITLDGKSSIKINGRTVTLSLVKEIVPALITIHGQSDTSAITDPLHQIELIDVYSSNAALLSEYSLKYKEYYDISTRISDIEKREAERERMIEMLEYQIKDIDKLALYDGEEEELIDKKVKIKNSEKISKNAGFVF